MRMFKEYTVLKQSKGYIVVIFGRIYAFSSKRAATAFCKAEEAALLNG